MFLVLANQPAGFLDYLEDKITNFYLAKWHPQEALVWDLPEREYSRLPLDVAPDIDINDNTLSTCY